VTGGGDGAFAFYSPTGRLLAVEPTHELERDCTDWLRAWADERKLDLGPDVNMPRWDGKAPDYALAVECLLAAVS